MGLMTANIRHTLLNLVKIKVVLSSNTLLTFNATPRMFLPLFIQLVLVPAAGVTHPGTKAELRELPFGRLAFLEGATCQIGLRDPSN